jgi:hypothetical protein
MRAVNRCRLTKLRVAVKMPVVVESGAQGRNRTADTVIFSHVLYQLSYLGSRDAASRPSKRRAPYLPLSSLSTPPGSAGGPEMR